METRIGVLEDCGGSVVICDHCEDVFSKLDRRYHDGDECPTCRDGGDEALGSRPTASGEG